MAEILGYFMYRLVLHELGRHDIAQDAQNLGFCHQDQVSEGVCFVVLEQVIGDRLSKATLKFHPVLSAVIVIIVHLPSIATILAGFRVGP